MKLAAIASLCVAASIGKSHAASIDHLLSLVAQVQDEAAQLVADYTAKEVEVDSLIGELATCEGVVSLPSSSVENHSSLPSNPDVAYSSGTTTPAAVDESNDDGVENAASSEPPGSSLYSEVEDEVDQDVTAEHDDGIEGSTEEAAKSSQTGMYSDTDDRWEGSSDAVKSSQTEMGSDVSGVSDTAEQVGTSDADWEQQQIVSEAGESSSQTDMGSDVSGVAVSADAEQVETSDADWEQQQIVSEAGQSSQTGMGSDISGVVVSADAEQVETSDADWEQQQIVSEAGQSSSQTDMGSDISGVAVSADAVQVETSDADWEQQQIVSEAGRSSSQTDKDMGSDISGIAVSADAEQVETSDADWQEMVWEAAQLSSDDYYRDEEKDQEGSYHFTHDVSSSPSPSSSSSSSGHHDEEIGTYEPVPVAPSSPPTQAPTPSSPISPAPTLTPNATPSSPTLLAPTPISPTPSSGSFTFHSDQTWNYNLDSPWNTEDVDVDVYFVDMNIGAEAIVDLHARGKGVVCYISIGTVEDWRDDSGDFPEDAIGNSLGDWEGERWLDVSNPDIQDIMKKRVEKAAEMNCDAVEPDHMMVAFENDTGVDVSREEQIAYDIWFAGEVHEAGMFVGLKNAVEILEDVVDDFDFALNESCHYYNECSGYESTFLAQGKPVFNIEYEYGKAVCDEANELGLNTILKRYNVRAPFCSCVDPSKDYRCMH